MKKESEKPRNAEKPQNTVKPQITESKPEIKVKTNPKADAMRKAPDEVVAMAIREALLKDKSL